MPRPPPRSTLFPYTTLFRSLREAGLVLVRDHVGADALREARGVARALGRPWSRLVLQGGIDGHDTREPGDRKSTRLNSSHVEISYAVFCLKKKKVAEAEAAA